MKLAKRTEQSSRLQYSRPQMPDFTHYFWATERKPLHFITRPPPNLSHDVVYLSSYLHDAELSDTSLKRRGSTVLIEVQRDCWEIGYGHNPHLPNESELLHVQAVLTVKPVATVTWRKPKGSSKMQIGTAYLTFESEGGVALILAGGSRWRLSLTFGDTPEIELRDIEMPHSVCGVAAGEDLRESDADILSKKTTKLRRGKREKDFGCHFD